MAKIVVRTQYYKGKKVAGTSNLLKYIATREGVEKVDSNSDRSPSTKQQDDLVYRVIRHHPETTMFPEFNTYVENMTKANADEFLSAAMDKAADLKTLVHYIGERPGVEKFGSHGLFSDTDDDIDLEKAAEEVAAVNGIVFSDVISLRREDASRLGYDNAEAWKNCVRRNVNEIAEAHKIPISEMKWYAAFHNTAHHPHIHLMVYSAKGSGYITEKGYKKLKSAFANDIFRNEQYKLFKLQTDIREELKDKYDALLQKLSAGNDKTMITAPCLDLAMCLSWYSGRKQYAYLPKELKEKVDFILKALAKYEPEISELYSEWNRLNREKLSVYYDSSNEPDIPLEENKEFQVLKNKIISYCLQFDLFNGTNPPEVAVQNNMSLAGEISFMVAFFINTANQRRLDTLHSYLDEKERKKLLRKKQAHGQKDGVEENTKREKDESESQRAADNLEAAVDISAAVITAAHEIAKAKNEQKEKVEEVRTVFSENYYHNQHDEEGYYEEEDEDEGMVFGGM